MGMTAENLARKYEISRTEQDEFAVESHRKAHEAQEAGRFADELVSVPVRVDKRKGAKIESKEVMFEKDELVRPESTLETLAKLKPSFHVKGSVTPANSSPISDGAAAIVVANARGLRRLLGPALIAVTLLLTLAYFAHIMTFYYILKWI